MTGIYGLLDCSDFGVGGWDRGAPSRGGDGLPGFAGDVVVGAEVEDVPFVSVVFAVGVEGFDADSFDGGEVVDFDAFAGEGVEVETDGGFGAGGVGVFGGGLGEGGNAGVEASFCRLCRRGRRGGRPPLYRAGWGWRRGR